MLVVEGLDNVFRTRIDVYLSLFRNYLSSSTSTVLQHILCIVRQNAIQMHSVYDLPLPSSYNRAPNVSCVFFTFSYACPLVFSPHFKSTGHERVNRLSHSQRWLCRCRDWSKLHRMHRSRKKFPTSGTVVHLCGVIFLLCVRVQLLVDGYVRILSSSLGFDKNGSSTRYNRL